MLFVYGGLFALNAPLPVATNNRPPGLGFPEEFETVSAAKPAPDIQMPEPEPFAVEQNAPVCRSEDVL
jgi:hypothetical protein